MYGWVMAGALLGGPAHAADDEAGEPPARGGDEPFDPTMAPGEDEDEPRVRLTARGGYTNYSRLHFVTGEAEVAMRLVSVVHAVGGVGVYGVELTPPPQRQLETGKLKEWAAFAPVHLGARAQFPILLNPFVGVDVLTTRYYQSEDGGAWALGARLRTGVDWMIVDQLGLHVNVGLGVWSGDRWGEVETGVPRTGPLPQLAAGLTYTL